MISCRCFVSILCDHAHQWFPDEREEKSRTQRQTHKQNTPSTPESDSRPAGCDSTASPTSTSKRSSRFLWMGAEGLDEGDVQNPPSGDPASLLRSITLPVNEVLQAVALATEVQNLVCRECRQAIDEPGRWRGQCRREHWIDEDRFEQGDVEGWVDPERVGQLETDGHGGDHLLEWWMWTECCGRTPPMGAETTRMWGLRMPDSIGWSPASDLPSQLGR